MDEFEKVYNKALRFLSYRPRSEKEVRDNLLRKKASSQIVEQVIAKLKEQRFLNDEEFVKWWVEQRTTFKPRSMRIIKIELKQKGIPQEIIEKVVHSSQFIVHSDLEQAKKLVQKKIHRYKDFSKQELYKKLGGFLASKGFSWDVIKKSIDEEVLKGV